MCQKVEKLPQKYQKKQIPKYTKIQKYNRIPKSKNSQQYKKYKYVNKQLKTVDILNSKNHLKTKNTKKLKQVILNIQKSTTKLTTQTQKTVQNRRTPAINNNNDYKIIKKTVTKTKNMFNKELQNYKNNQKNTTI